jgi:hypothetical protein
VWVTLDEDPDRLPLPVQVYDVIDAPTSVEVEVNAHVVRLQDLLKAAVSWLVTVAWPVGGEVALPALFTAVTSYQ